MILIDSSFFISLFLDTDPNYSRAASRYPSVLEEKIVTEDILKETLTVLSQRKGKAASIDAFQKISTDCAILPVSSVRFRAGLQTFLNPKTPKDISLIDCVTAAICKELRINKILTFDRHFKLFGLRVLP